MVRYNGFYRAKVVENKDPKKFGRVQVWIPDIMIEVDETKGIWARPANNPIGGRNTGKESKNHYMGTSYIPAKGSWVFIFFEAGNVNRPYYFGALDLENDKVLPENQVGSNYEEKWTIFKSHDGRCVVVSDDPDDCRVEITGKKKQLSSPVAGDTSSVYTIDGNQTTILLDERAGKEKILIRTHKGDFINIDTEERILYAQFESGMQILSKGDLMLSSNNNIHIKAKDINIQSDKDMNIKSNGKLNARSASDTNIQSTGKTSIGSAQMVHIKSTAKLNLECAGMMSLMAPGGISLDGPLMKGQCGAAGPAGDPSGAGSATKANPKGDRDS